ncbi:MAG: YfhO family protein [Bacteroides sp.]|nr:YfhO family protein [Bacteroides sp.]
MKKNLLFPILSVVALAIIALTFFYPDALQGNLLQQHDILQGLANGQEGKAFTEQTGQTTRWTDALFGGMPNFQIAPSYPANSLLEWVGKIYMLGLPSPANLLFGMMLGFFILCLCLKMKWPTALFAAIAWGFSSYFIIIIGAGHIWKFLALCYIPPTIGGIVLLYRGKWLRGLALASLFGALQLQSNHPQMSYYFLLVIFCLMMGWLWMAWKNAQMKQWLMATLLSLCAGALAVGANSASLYNSLEYSKETVRGRATEIPLPGQSAEEAAGMDREAITAWSYSPSETFSLLIPNVKGGATIKPVGGQNKVLSSAETPAGARVTLSPEESQVAASFPQYFGDQPMTNGPVYVGAFVLLLAILGLFTLRGRVETPMKWALLAASVLAILLSWGHNFPALTNFFIDHFPGYNKFRAVASILVIVEFCIPLLAALTLRQMVRDDNYFRENKWTVIAVFGCGAAICLLGWVAPSIFGTPYSAQEAEFLRSNGVFSNPAYANVLKSVSEGRLGLVSDDSLRSLLFILGAGAVLWMWSQKKMGQPYLWVGVLAVLALVDLYGVDKRYVNSENFLPPTDSEVGFTPTAADLQILKDTTNYRVMDVDGFSQARSSYFHKTIGGYHAAKLTRYNDLITHQISRGNQRVLDMLNAKYIISQGEVMENPGALGNAWFVDSIEYVATPAEEMAALDNLPVERAAVADAAFKGVLGEPSPIVAGDTIYETSYAPNRLTYRYRSAAPAVAVFSEVYFPWGWTATVDGAESAIGRVDYVLRALRLPAGEHEVEFRFDPQSLKTTNTISLASVGVIYLLVIMALVCFAIAWRRRSSSAKGK